MACDWAADQKHIMSTTVEGMINSTNIDENKMVMEHDTMALTPELPSNIVYSCKSVKNSPHKGNIFTIGAENKLVHVIEYDPSAKFESWRIEIKQKPQPLFNTNPQDKHLVCATRHHGGR